MKKIETIFVWIVKISLFIIPFLPLYVSTSMLFPFITGKNFGFRIITEIIFVFWAWLAIVNPQYRPKLTALCKVVTAFVAIVFFADVFGPNVYRSLFSNYERMEGFMMIGHLYLYYIMLVSVFRKRDWTIFFHSTLLASLCVSSIGLFQKLGLKVSLQGGFRVLKVSLQGGFRVDSTIGNPTYLAAYLLFHLCILLILMHAFRKKWWALSLYSLAFLFELAIVYFTATRGAVIGFVVSGIALAGTAVWQWSAIFPSETTKHTRWPLGRKLALGALSFIIIVPAIFWLSRNTDVVQSNQVLRRLTNYSLQEGTIQARFHIWGQSWKGFLERPILGWGQENYYLVFQKYYNPHLWSDEPWFDRSHNIFFDWLIHAGILGLGAYLGMYAILYAGIINGIKKHRVTMWSGAVVLAALLANIIQNLFVFDNLNTYLLFFAFLAFGSFLMKEPESNNEAKHHRMGATANTYSRAHAVTIALAALMLVWGYYIDIVPIQQSQALIQALIAFQEHVPMDQQINTFKKALSYNSFGNTEVREQILNLSRNVVGNQRYSNAEQVQYMTMAIDEMRKEIQRPAKDVKHLMFLGSLLDEALGVNADYQVEARNVLEEAVKLSPTKQIISFELAQHYVLTHQNDAARDLLYRVWKLDPTYQVAAIHAWVMAIVTHKLDTAHEFAAIYPPSSIAENDLLRLGEAYRRSQDYADALPMYAALVGGAPQNPKYHATYAALLANAGRFEEARVQAQETTKLDPSFAKEAGNFLQNLNAE